MYAFNEGAIKATDTTFVYNAATLYGGALSTYESTIDATDCAFDSNMVKFCINASSPTTHLHPHLRPTSFHLHTAHTQVSPFVPSRPTPPGQLDWRRNQRVRGLYRYDHRLHVYQ